MFYWTINPGKLTFHWKPEKMWLKFFYSLKFQKPTTGIERDSESQEDIKPRRLGVKKQVLGKFGLVSLF